VNGNLFEIETEGPDGTQPAMGLPFWLIHLMSVNGAMKLEFPSVKAELEALPKALVGKRAGSWAAYYAGTN